MTQFAEIAEPTLIHRLAMLKWQYGSTTYQPKCYISGPMSGLPHFNFPAFEKAADALREAGWFVYSPRENDAEKNLPGSTEGRFEDLGVEYKDLMKLDLWQVCDSDAVIALPGWEYSKGAQLEVTVAQEVGVPVYTLLNQRKIEYGEASLEPHDFSSREPLVTTGFDLLSEEGKEKARQMFYALTGGRAPEAEPTPLDFGPEWRGVDPDTGGSKGRRQATFANMSLVADVLEARVHGFGVMKYPDEAGAPNWTKGMPWSWLYDAQRRHIASFWSGEDINEESGLLHLAHARWMVSNLIEYWYYGLGTDDRPRWRRNRAA